MGKPFCNWVFFGVKVGFIGVAKCFVGIFVGIFQ